MSNSTESHAFFVSIGDKGLQKHGKKYIINLITTEMKHCLYFLFSFMLMSLPLDAQEAPQYRKVFLWDVTYSTHGGWAGSSYPTITKKVGKDKMEIKQYNKEYDIYDELVKNLIEVINDISNVQTEIIVVPFNDHVIDSWKAIPQFGIRIKIT